MSHIANRICTVGYMIGRVRLTIARPIVLELFYHFLNYKLFFILLSAQTEVLLWYSQQEKEISSITLQIEFFLV